MYREYSFLRMLGTTSSLADRLQLGSIYIGLFYGDHHNVHIDMVLVVVSVCSFVLCRLVGRSAQASLRLCPQFAPDSC